MEEVGGADAIARFFETRARTSRVPQPRRGHDLHAPLLSLGGSFVVLCSLWFAHEVSNDVRSVWCRRRRLSAGGVRVKIRRQIKETFLIQKEEEGMRACAHLRRQHGEVRAALVEAARVRAAALAHRGHRALPVVPHEAAYTEHHPFEP